MTYDLSKELDRQRFQARAAILAKRGAAVELSERAFRSRNQNNYLHLLIGVVAMETGTTLPYCKEVYFKRLANKDLFVSVRRDQYAGEVEILRSSTDLTKEEMSLAIDRFKRWAYEQGIAIPEQGDDELLKEAMIEMGRNRAYIGGTW
mgnify:CR=1 FL=1